MASTSQREPSEDVPIFLRKTFHMIDTCDPAIAGWSDDGETFVVKDPVKFELTIIPQFFKHNKFTSFVRQLNFYSFRKIKFTDGLRIDPELEKETANYWRFRHAHFRKGRPELLSEIKRMNSAARTSSTTNNASTSTTATQPDGKPEEKTVNSEVQTLKKKIEEMTRNIDDLTAIVQKVSLKQDEHETTPLFKTEEEDELFGNKRKKLLSPILPDMDDDAVRPDEMFSTMQLEEMVVADDPLPLPQAVASMPGPSPLSSRENSAGSTQSMALSDNEFVDQLFSAFSERDEALFLEGGTVSSNTFQGMKTTSNDQGKAGNRPDPELMQRLSDALMLLPKDIQEMIVNRLIAAITSTDFMQDSKMPAAVELPVTVEEPQSSPSSPKKEKAVYPLAAATLAALLHHYTTQVQQEEENDKSSKNVQKSIPVIPVHA